MIRDTDSPAGARQKLVFEYDHQGRRIRKQFFTYSGGWQEQTDTIFLYDGWNLVAELNANASNARVRTYVWGSDLSGSMHGAGGVGGLLKLTYYGTSTTNAFVAYDGNGNVTALIDAANGSICARYEYGPFAEPVRSSGSLSKQNPIRFSTKYTDTESGFLYYGYRYYNPSTGRWLSRDPLGEQGSELVRQERRNNLGNGANHYAFVRNASQSRFDLLGLYDNCCCDTRRVRRGELILTLRYLKARSYWESQGIPHKEEDTDAYSCIELNGKILAFITPAPHCWTCSLERRWSDRVAFNRDHWVVVCVSHPMWALPKEIMFDYWGDRPPAESPDTWYRARYPKLQEVSLSAKYSDCSQPEKPAENYEWLAVIHPPRN